jgi:hypothetical protein
MIERGMSPQLAEVYKELIKDVNWLYFKWNIYLQLYADQENVKLLNNTAPTYFSVCQEMMQDDTLLAIGRLTDPAQTGSKTNLSLQQLVDTINEVAYPVLRSEVMDVLTAAKPKFEVARDHRNRRIAHIDLETRLNKHPQPLSDATKHIIEEALEAIAQALNTVERHFDTKTEFSEQIVPNDGKTLLHWLRLGYANRQF